MAEQCHRHRENLSVGGKLAVPMVQTIERKTPGDTKIYHPTFNASQAITETMDQKEGILRQQHPELADPETEIPLPNSSQYASNAGTLMREHTAHSTHTLAPKEQKTATSIYYSTSYINAKDVVCPRPKRLIPALAADIEATVPLYNFLEEHDAKHSDKSKEPRSSSNTYGDAVEIGSAIKKDVLASLMADLEKVATDYKNKRWMHEDSFGKIFVMQDPSCRWCY